MNEFHPHSCICFHVHSLPHWNHALALMFIHFHIRTMH
ncbi:hypothetical protein LINPERHAP1_LOCUS14203 [Linum perenne]